MYPRNFFVKFSFKKHVLSLQSMIYLQVKPGKHQQRNISSIVQVPLYNIPRQLTLVYIINKLA